MRVCAEKSVVDGVVLSPVLFWSCGSSDEWWQMDFSFRRDWELFSSQQQMSPSSRKAAAALIWFQSSLAWKQKNNLSCFSSISAVNNWVYNYRKLHPGASAGCACDCGVYSQLCWSSCRRSLCAFSYLILLLALLLPSVVGALLHRKPPLRVRGHFGVIVLGQFS